MHLARHGWPLACALLLSCSGNDGPAPLSGTVEAWTDRYTYVVVPGAGALLTSVQLYNGTEVAIVQPNCAMSPGYPVEDTPSLAVGFEILKEAPDGSWQVWENSGIPECAAANPELANVLEPGFHGASQQLAVPQEPGRYSWVISYYPSEASSELLSVATAPVTVLSD